MYLHTICNVIVSNACKYSGYLPLIFWKYWRQYLLCFFRKSMYISTGGSCSRRSLRSTFKECQLTEFADISVDKDSVAGEFFKGVGTDLIHRHPVDGIRDIQLHLRLSSIFCDLHAVTLFAEGKARSNSLLRSHLNMRHCN